MLVSGEAGAGKSTLLEALEHDRYGLPPFYSLHAWVWDHNPAGRFAPYNPSVKCPS